MRISREEYNEWRESQITKQLFDFFKLEAELWRRQLAAGTLQGSDEEVGEKYKEIVFAINCYEQLVTIGYEDLFPIEDNKDEES